MSSLASPPNAHFATQEPNACKGKLFGVDTCSSFYVGASFLELLDGCFVLMVYESLYGMITIGCYMLLELRIWDQRSARARVVLAFRKDCSWWEDGSKEELGLHGR